MTPKHSKTLGHILIVEDEETLLENLKLNLELEQYEVSTCTDGSTVLRLVKNEVFDLIILDIMLPEMDGLSVCEAIRLQQIDVPILFLSAKGSSADRVEGLKKGGDDYLTKPFNLEELLLRVKKLIDKNNRTKVQPALADTFEFENYYIDFNAHHFTDGDNEPQELSKKEIALLKLLIEHEGQVVSREHILKVVWGYNVFPTTRTIDNFILNFRKYFENDSRNPKHFHSVRGIGYKFTA